MKNNVFNQIKISLRGHWRIQAISSFCYFRGSAKEEVATETLTKPRKTRRAKDMSSEDGSEFPKLAYLTVEEFEEIPK